MQVKNKDDMCTNILYSNFLYLKNWFRLNYYSKIFIFNIINVFNK